MTPADKAPSSFATLAQAAKAAATKRILPAPIVPTAHRVNKVLNSSHDPAQRSLFLRPSGAR
jgi:hypothetical protein